MTTLLRPDAALVALTGLGVLPMALGLSLSAGDRIGTGRLEAITKTIAFVWGLIIGAAYYVILVVIAVPGIILIFYEAVTDSEADAPRSLLDWITGLSYWESDNYAYAFGDRDEPAWLPDREQER